MRLAFKSFLTTVFLLLTSVAIGQDFSNKGKDFWIPYPEHIDGTNSAMGIYITSDSAATGTITVAGTTLPFTLAANTVVRKFLGPNAAGDAPNTGVHLGSLQDGIGAGKAIHVVSDKPVVVFAHIIRSARSGASLILPVTVWGKEYIAPSMGTTGNSNSYGEICVMASLPNTQIEITPSKATRSGRPAGVPFTVTLLNVGDVYQLQFLNKEDLSGTKVRSIATGQGGCVPIAVFSATTWSAFTCNNASGGDNLYQQLFPTGTYGKQFLTGPLKKVATSATDNNTDIIRVYVTDPATVVTRTLNGTVSTLTGLVASGNYYEYTSSVPTLIQADKPVQVVQYVASQNCGSPQTNSDPEMIVLSAVEQTINDITVFSAHQSFVPIGQSQVTTHYINVIMKTANAGTFRINGVLPTATFTAIPGTSYSYLKEDVTARAATNPVFQLKADSGFNAIAYGFGNVESYGYNAGTNVKDQYQYISLQNQYATVNFPATCRNTPFNFSMTFPYQPTQIQWIFGTALNGMGIADVTIPSPVPTTTIVVNGKTLYVYQLSGTYSIPTAGTYQIQVKAINPTPDGCSGEQLIPFELVVYPTPIADFNATNVCFGSNVQFTDISQTNNRPITTNYWDFGDNTTGNTPNPSHLYASVGTYTARHAVITDVGCISDTISKPVVVYPKPTATITGTANICEGAAQPLITFTGADGTAPYRFTYTINGGAPQQIVTTSGNSVTLSVPTNTVGAFVYALNSVSDASPLNCAQSQTGSATVTVFSKPTGATISGSTAVCLNGTAPTLTLSGVGGSGNYLFTYNINGGTNQTVLSTAGTASITVPTNAAGTFTYNLVSVEDPSNTLCNLAVSGFATVTVNPLPTASIAGTTSVCQNAPAPNVSFTGSGGTAPYTFNYSINGGPLQQVISAANGIGTVAAPTATPGTYTYALFSVTDGSSTLCAQNQTGNVVVIVNPLPTASIAGTTAVCQSAAQPTVTFTGASGTAPYTFNYNIDGGTNQTVVTTTGNSITVSVPTATPGTFTYNLISVTDASSTICSQNQSGSAIITVNPLPTASIAGTINVCQNATAPLITFTGATGTAPYTFSYNINGGVAQTVTTAAGNSATVAAPTGVAGTFVYNLISVTDASSTICTQNQTGSATVLVYPLPTASFAPVTPVCETRVVSFTDQSVANAGNITGWSWNFGDPASGALNTSTAQNPTHIFSTAGTYNVALVVTTNNGCVSVNPSIPVVVHARPKAGFINPEVCLNDTYGQFNDTSSVAAPSTITGWNWNFGDPASGVNNTSILQNPQHSYLAVGSYPITLIVTSSQGCKDTVNQNLFVNGSFPVSNFTINNLSNLCANDSISITDGATVVPGVITKIEIYWDDAGQPAVFDVDQNPTPGKVYKHLYPNFQSPLTRTFNIRYRAFSGGVCSNDKLIPVTINAAPKVQFSTLPPICLDAAPYQITQATEIGGVPGSLLFTGPGVSPTGLFSPLVAGPGTHTIRYYFTSTAGGCIDSATQTIRVWIAPTADFTVSSPVCERQAVIFTSTSTSTEGTLTQWRWDFGDGTPVLIQNTAAPVQHTFATYGNFVVKLNVVTSNGCVSVAKTMTVTVKPLARPNFSFPAVSCLPDANIAFTNLSTIPDGTQSAFTYLWNFGDPGSGPVNTSTAINPSHTYVALGPYNVNLQVTSEAGCIHDTTIVLNTLHPQPAGSFTTDKIDVCVGGAIRFTSTSTAADGTISQWVWNMDNGDTRNQPTFNYTYSTVGTYNVSHYIVNSFNCKSSTATTTVSINPYPIADAGPDKLMLEGGQTQLTPLNNNTMPVTFRWRPATYLSDSTVQSPIARPPDDIYYTYVITTDKGCSAQDVLFVKVLKAPIVPNIFSPNGDGVHDTWVLPYLDSYPGCTVEVVNRYGQSVFRSVGYTTPWDGTVNGKPVPVGTYYFVIDPKNGRKRLAGYVDIIR
ncbi:MAG: hypothetical protein RIQ34_453 [Bacteroidota bacterium]